MSDKLKKPCHADDDVGEETCECIEVDDNYHFPDDCTQAKVYGKTWETCPFGKLYGR